MKTIHNLISELIELFTTEKLENPENDAEKILQFVLKKNRSDLYLNSLSPVSQIELDRIYEIADRRLKGEPLQYIFGETFFLGNRILVSEKVLIPRQETEFLIDIIILENRSLTSILEIGTGSGALAIALAKHFPEAMITASDISSDALEIARTNAELNDVEIRFLQSDLFENIEERFDLIVSNPPYISGQDYIHLTPEIVDHEPKRALLAGQNGLFYYEKILSEANEYLTGKGKIYFEIGYDQAGKIKKIAFRNGFERVEVFPDLNKYDRFMRIS